MLATRRAINPARRPLVALMGRLSVRKDRSGMKRIAYSAASAIAAALASPLVGDISRIPGGYLGVAGFAVMVFVIALYGYGRID